MNISKSINNKGYSGKYGGPFCDGMCLCKNCISMYKLVNWKVIFSKVVMKEIEDMNNKKSILKINSP